MWVGSSSSEDVVCSLSCVNVSIVYMTQFTVNGHCVGSSNSTDNNGSVGIQYIIQCSVHVSH